MEFPGEKLVIKLWETLTEKGVGSLLAPWQSIREGKARIEIRRRELLMLAQAEVDTAEIRAGRKRLEPDGSLRSLQVPDSQSDAIVHQDERIELRLNTRSLAEISVRTSTAQEVCKEINISKAIIHAEEVLANDPQKPPDRPVEEDWLFSWREYAGRVSTTDLQQMWGKILAGEIKSPGSYSIRTLDFLKGLSKNEAEKISKLAGYVIEGRIFRNLQQYLQEHGISFDLLLEMQELGLLSGVDSIGLSSEYKSPVEEHYKNVFRSNGKVLVVMDDDPAKVLKINNFPLTSVGKQLLGLGNFVPNIEYLRLAGKEILKQGFTVYLADWVQYTENSGRYLNAERIDA